jgi:hypothetical protein
LLPRPDLTYEKKKKQNTHDAATKFKFLYKINQRNNQSKNHTYGWPWLMKKNQEETKIIFQTCPNLFKLV